MSQAYLTGCIWWTSALQWSISAANLTLEGVRALQQGVAGPLDLAKVNGAGESVGRVHKFGAADTLPSGHGCVHNASHHVDGVLNVYAPPLGKGEPPVTLGCRFNGVCLE